MLANSLDPDQTLCSAASDLGLHCLPRSQKRHARLIWVELILHITVNFGILHKLSCSRYQKGLISGSIFPIQMTQV